MTETQLMEDLEHRRDLAAELARFADGQQGLGLGTALAGLLACLNPVLIWLGWSQAVCFIHRHSEPAGFWGNHGPLLIVLFISAIVFLNAFGWLLLKNAVPARLYRRLGEACSVQPSWEARVGVVLLCGLGYVGLWIGGSTLLALRIPAGPELSPVSLWGIPALKVMASVALLGTAVLLAAAWRRVQGWRNWLGWAALCAPFLLFVSAPLFDNRHPSLLAVILLLTLMASCLYLPFMAIYVGLRDHLRYGRLVKVLCNLPPVEEGQ